MEKDITALLREKGFKVTPQRLAIYGALAATKAHPSAEMLFNELQPHYPTMSLATVYKTIEILRELDLVQVLNTGEDSFRYDADTSNHPHVRCLSCQRVDDVDPVDWDSFYKAVEVSTKYELSGHQFYFYGICPACQNAGQRQEH